MEEDGYSMEEGLIKKRWLKEELHPGLQEEFTLSDWRKWNGLSEERQQEYIDVSWEIYKRQKMNGGRRSVYLPLLPPQTHTQVAHKLSTHSSAHDSARLNRSHYHCQHASSAQIPSFYHITKHEIKQSPSHLSQSLANEIQDEPSLPDKGDGEEKEWEKEKMLESLMKDETGEEVELGVEGGGGGERSVGRDLFYPHDKGWGWKEEWEFWTGLNQEMKERCLAEMWDRKRGHKAAGPTTNSFPTSKSEVKMEGERDVGDGGSGAASEYVLRTSLDEEDLIHCDCNPVEIRASPGLHLSPSITFPITKILVGNLHGRVVSQSDGLFLQLDPVPVKNL